MADLVEPPKKRRRLFENTVSDNADDDSNTVDQDETNSQEFQELSVQRRMNCLVQAVHCSDLNCRLSSCQRMKRAIEHERNCERKKYNDCLICKQLIALCSEHAKDCQVAKCTVPFCGRWHKLQQQLQEVQQKIQLLRRYIITLQNLIRQRHTHFTVRYHG